MGDGWQAVQRVEQQPTAFDLILMDGHMPVMTGMEATKEIRTRGIRIPILALTGNALEQDKHAFLDAGVNDVMSKPFNKKIFFEKLTTVLCNHNPS
eukprot:TRINITY_DN5499_c0_g1_i3.p1 TRINITY_DN5499_c0_g1~~TRINITY_DN5499_c0_g1_i3.p1  ORF type:complete len:104 (-),score=22.26 TRINITY_DN5499_c0_g1_i3:200-487(-)